MSGLLVVCCLFAKRKGKEVTDRSFAAGLNRMGGPNILNAFMMQDYPPIERD